MIKQLKYISLASFCMLFAFSGEIATASNDFKKELQLGASFSSSFSSVSLQPAINQKMLMGFGGGASLRWITEKHLGLQVELNYTQKGWSEMYEETPQFFYDRTINYLEMPLMTHIYFGKKNFRFIFNLGPKIAFMLNETTRDNLNGERPNKENTQHGMPVENRFDWGLCGGPGIELRTGIGSFVLEGRYYFGLGDFYGNRSEDYFSKSSHQVISAKMTWFLPAF